MDRSYRFACFVLLAVWTGGVVAAQQSTDTVEQTLIELERGWNTAFYDRDVAFLDSILAEDFIVTYDDGTRGDKARELELAETFNQRVVSATQEDFIVQVYGDSAVVWFTLRVVGIRQGQEAEVMLRYTDVWVQRDGRWQCVSSHSTRVR
ncbi:MAG: nuclear transport factor 2 family protein [Acidobacteria bacterium]|nr:nuclear transport factor 2 family protein [Acidobacteriota bacterium]MYJ03411.1 nuclear transport factor 2 family protein [Acidobacteriota bacterium]